MKRKEIETITCKLCGKQHRLSYGDELNAKLKLNETCHGCDFWLERKIDLDLEPELTLVVADGRHGYPKNVYSVARHSSTFSRGYGGRRFDYVDADGKKWYTTNLWHRGDVPEHFPDEFFPVNATWIDEDEESELNEGVSKFDY